MGHQQDRLPRACAVQACHEIPFARRRVEDLDVSAGVACGAEPGSHRFGRFRRVAGGRDGIDLHELPINIARELLLGGQRLRPSGKEPVHERDEKEHKQPRRYGTVHLKFHAHRDFRLNTRMDTLIHSAHCRVNRNSFSRIIVPLGDSSLGADREGETPTAVTCGSSAKHLILVRRMRAGGRS